VHGVWGRPDGATAVMSVIKVTTLDGGFAKVLVLRLYRGICYGVAFYVATFGSDKPAKCKNSKKDL